MSTLLFTIWASLLATLSTPDLVDTAQREVALLDQAAQLYQVMHGGACPKDVQGLREEVLPDAKSKDPWGTGYGLSCPSPGTALARSAGPDRRFDTADDVRSDALQSR